MPSHRLSRREFLKVAGTTALGSALASCGPTPFPTITPADTPTLARSNTPFPTATLIPTITPQSTAISKPEVEFTKLYTLVGHKDGIRGLAYSPDGKILASGSVDKTIKLWDVTNGKELQTLNHGDGVWHIAYSPDGKFIASGGDDQTTKLWNAINGTKIHTLVGHTNFVGSVAFSPDGKTLASGSIDDTIRFWDVATGIELRNWKAEVYDIAYSPDRKTLAVGSGESVKLLDLANGKELRKFQGGYPFAFSADWKMLATSSVATRLTNGRLEIVGETVTIFDFESGKELLQILMSRSNRQLRGIAFSLNGKRLMTGGADRMVTIWDLRDGKHIGSLSGHTDWVTSVTYSPDGKTIASGSADATVIVWQVNN